MKEVIKYVYDSKGRRYGCVVGIKSEDGHNMIGVSRCKLSEDNFSKRKAVELARDRAIKWSIRDGKDNVHNPLLHRLHDYLLKFRYNGLAEEEKFAETIDFINNVLNKKKVPDAGPTWES